MNSNKIIKCRVKSDSTFTDLIGYDLLVVRDKAFYRIDTIISEQLPIGLSKKYCGFLIGREQLDLNVYDHREELAEVFKGFKDIPKPMKCKVKPSFGYYADLKDHELFVTPTEDNNLYRLDSITKDYSRGDDSYYDYLTYNFRIGENNNRFCISAEDLDFQIEDLKIKGPVGIDRNSFYSKEGLEAKKELFRPKDSDPKPDNTNKIMEEVGYIPYANVTIPNPFREFESGAIRDVDGKEDYVETQSFLAMKRYAEYMTAQAKKYGRGNWRKGIPIEEYEKSLMRHIHKYFANKYDNANLEPEIDHLSAIRFNLDGIIHEEEKLKLNNNQNEFKRL